MNGERPQPSSAKAPAGRETQEGARELLAAECVERAARGEVPETADRETQEVPTPSQCSAVPGGRNTLAVIHPVSGGACILANVSIIRDRDVAKSIRDAVADGCSQVWMTVEEAKKSWGKHGDWQALKEAARRDATASEVVAHLDRIVELVKGLKLPRQANERAMCDAIRVALRGAGIAFDEEVTAGKGGRLDFFTGLGVAIEAKVWRPNPAVVLGQVQRYCGLEAVRGLLVVCEGRQLPMPRVCQGKPVRTVCLVTNWGVANG